VREKRVLFWALFIICPPLPFALVGIEWLVQGNIERGKRRKK
jgi:hypothetical protein